MSADEKPKIGAPNKGLEGKKQITISVQKKVVKELGLDYIKKTASSVINMAYEQKLKSKTE